MQFNYCKGLEKPWSVITFGCWQIAPSGGWGDVCTEQEAESAIKAALNGGIRAFDTAEGYGDGESERRLGKALGSKKYEVLIISKIWPDAELTLKAYQERLENTLLALDRDYVDVYLVHWPGDFFDTSEKSKKLIDIMTQLRGSGKTKTIGLSNFKTQDLERLNKDLSEFVVNQIPYNLLQREYEDTSLAKCKTSGVKYMAYSPTGRGLLGGRFEENGLDYPTRKNYHLYQEPLFSKAKQVYKSLKSIAEEIGTQPINVAIAWVLEQENIVTAAVGSRKATQVEEFSQAGDLKLSKEHLQQLNALSDDFYKQI